MSISDKGEVCTSISSEGEVCTSISSEGEVFTSISDKGEVLETQKTIGFADALQLYQLIVV